MKTNSQNQNHIDSENRFGFKKYEIGQMISDINIDKKKYRETHMSFRWRRKDWEYDT